MNRKRRGLTTNKELVSVVAAVKDEEKYIARMLDSVACQDYGSDNIEVIICDDHSRDGTRAVAEQFHRRFSSFKLLVNPGKGNTAGLNAAIENAEGHYILLASGHCWFEPDYLSNCVAAHRNGNFEIVGGRTVAEANTPVAQAIRAVLSSPFGTGAARFRYANKAGEVKTVAFGLMKRELFDRIGLFDTGFLKNQDDEFSFRVLKTGGKILCQPQAVAHYRVRDSLKGFMLQYIRYGFWKVGHLRKFKALPSITQLAPPLFAIGVAVSILLFLLVDDLRLPLLLLAGIYLVFSYITTYGNLGPRRLILWCFSPLFYFLLHSSYGIGFIGGLISLLFSGRIAGIEKWQGKMDDH